MCGLVGVMGNIIRRDRVALYWLLHLDVIRGEDSTGIAAIHKETLGGKDHFTARVFKEVGHPSELYDSYPEDFPNDFYEPKNGAYNSYCLIGHNRAATQGLVNANNAHPFDMGNVIGAHNGTVDQWTMTSLNGYEEHDIDSKIIYQHINDTGQVQEVWDVADGAMALTWWDKKENALKVVRNNQRPLHYAISKDKKLIYWASKPWMLIAALAKCGIAYDKIEEFPVDTLFTITTAPNKDIVMERSPLTPFVESPWGYGYGVAGFGRNSHVPKGLDYLQIKDFVKEGGKPWQGYFIAHNVDEEEIMISIDSVDEQVQKNRYERLMSYGSSWHFYYKSDLLMRDGWPTLREYNLTTTKPPSQTESNKQIPMGMVEIEEGELLTRKEFEQDYKDGCDWCTSPVKFEDAHKAIFCDGLMICKDCKDHDIVKEFLSMEKQHAN